MLPTAKRPKSHSKNICISHAGSLTKSSEATETFGAGSIQRGRRCIRLARRHPGRRKEDAGIHGEEKKPPLMTPKDLQKHICKESLVKDVVWNNFSVHQPDSEATEDASTKPSEKFQSRDRKEKAKDKQNKTNGYQKPKKHACCAPSLCW